MDCHTSIAANATLVGDRLSLSVFVSDPAATREIRTQAHSAVEEMQQLLDAVAATLFEQGALELITAGATA
jgi:porphobilinogen deaminase